MYCFKCLLSIVCDYITESDKLSTQGRGFDIVNFGFETSMSALEKNKHIFNDKALILAPISLDDEGSLE